MAHTNIAKRGISAHLGSKGRSYGLHCPVQRDHCTHTAKIMESLVSPTKTDPPSKAPASQSDLRVGSVFHTENEGFIKFSNSLGGEAGLM